MCLLIKINRGFSEKSTRSIFVNHDTNIDILRVFRSNFENVIAIDLIERRCQLREGKRKKSMTNNAELPEFDVSST